MSIFLVLLSVALSQEHRAVLLAARDDTAFILPLSSVQHTDHTTLAALVSVYPEASEPWEEERREASVEVDCATNHWRILDEKRIARNGNVKQTEDVSSAWEPIPESFPPAMALKAIICSGVDPSQLAFPEWESRLPEIRASLR